MGVKLLDRVRAAIQMRHYSRRPEEAYVYWIRRYIIFHTKVHPSTMGAPEIYTHVLNRGALGVRSPADRL